MPTTKPKHLEVVFEDEIVAHLTAPGAGWVAGDPSSYDKELALDPAPLLAFIEDSQPTTWAEYKAKHNGQSEKKLL